jgi:hypothetical protein
MILEEDEYTGELRAYPPGGCHLIENLGAVIRFYALSQICCICVAKYNGADKCRFPPRRQSKHSKLSSYHHVQWQYN